MGIYANAEVNHPRLFGSIARFAMATSSTSGDTSVHRHAEEATLLFGGDALTDLQLRVARRADELVRAQHLGNGLHRHYWLLAEAEITRGFFEGTSSDEKRRAYRDEFLSS